MLLSLVWFAGVAIVAWTARWPDPYLEHVRGIPPPHPYPLGSVLWIVLLMTLEGAVLAAILRPWSYARSWGRALVGFGVAGGFFAFGALGLMHAPPYYGYYSLWMLVIAIGLLGIVTWSGVASVRGTKSNTRQG